MIRRPLVTANWKMHGQAQESASLLASLVSGIGSIENYDVVICPPSLYIPQAQQILTDAYIQLGAQNVYIGEQGAFTGEISAKMLKDFDCEFVIVGHSERREIFGESDELVVKKFAAVQEQGLTPILCVGETLSHRESGKTESVILGQIEALLNALGVKVLEQAVIAYEPIWAIGTGKTASPEQAQEVHALIRKRISQDDSLIANKIRLLYGGSVKSANAAELFAQEDIDGALVGGASLIAEEFTAICKAADAAV